MGRKICEYTEGRKGPLLIVFGGMHGNEPAGIAALTRLQELLQREPEINPGFKFNGKILGLIGNKRAYALKKRFIDQDLNRSWELETIKSLETKPKEEFLSEELEMEEILEIIHKEIGELQPEKVIVLDIHTTSAKGGIFSIVTNQQESVELAFNLHAPVVKGMLENLHGTTMHYFHPNNFNTPIVTISFEAGQHYEPKSEKRALSAVINIMRSIGQVSERDVETKHDRILQNYSVGLPKVLQLIRSHAICEEDRFSMKAGFSNFETIEKGQTLATDINGDIMASQSGLILMPLYQEQGVDGFFLVRDISNSF